MTSLDTYPRLCGSVAGKASKLGVALHTAGYRALGLDFTYVALGTDDLTQAVAGFRALSFRGFGVSMPFKAEILNHLDDVSDDVRSIGACNTVVNDNGVLKGHNTDWQGAMTAIEEIGATRAETALIVGAGGVARAIAFGLKKKGWKVAIAARDPKKGDKLASDLSLDNSVPISQQKEVRAQLIVNATPVAEAHGGPVLIEPQTTARYLLDVVFSPKETNLAAVARQTGLSVAPGWRMLLHQALHQFKLYTDCDPPQAPMSAVLEDALG